VYDWNDLRHFLAVARAGSTLAAAARLNTNQTTVARRIAALEEALGAALFERSPSGYRLTECGREILAAAERVEAEAQVVDELVLQRRRSIAGAIRVTTNEPLANFFLVPVLPQFAERYPDVRIEIIVADRALDLGRGEADVAIRAGMTPGEGAIVARKLSEIPWWVYCSEAYARAHGAPAGVEDLSRHAVIGGSGTLAEVSAIRWLESHSTRPVAARSSSVGSLVTATKAGLGLATLPCMLANPEPDLRPCLPTPLQFQAKMWLVTRADLKNEPRVKAFNAFIAEKAAAMRPVFEPQPQPA
jgi:DNA-binding transcriptional LysR family regulator